MERRVLDFATGNCRLSKRRGFLVVTRPINSLETEEQLFPFDEIESVIVHSPQVSYSNSALITLAENSIPVVCCDEKHLPVAWVWPVKAHHEQSRRMALQAGMPDPLRDELWQTLIQAKLQSQAAVLEYANLNPEPVLTMAANVDPGDANNAEALGARIYWDQMFDKQFRRAREGAPPNSLLNYGYTVLRATAARHICSSGLHPSLGIHHHNRFNAFCLADDLMEPFRAGVDRTVVEMWNEGKTAVDLEAKERLVAVMSMSMETIRGKAPLSRCVEWAAQSLVKSVLDSENRLSLPDPTSFSE